MTSAAHRESRSALFRVRLPLPVSQPCFHVPCSPPSSSSLPPPIIMFNPPRHPPDVNVARAGAPAIYAFAIKNIGCTCYLAALFQLIAVILNHVPRAGSWLTNAAADAIMSGVSGDTAHGAITQAAQLLMKVSTGTFSSV